MTHAGNQLRLLGELETTFAKALLSVAQRHVERHNDAATFALLAQWSVEHGRLLATIVTRYPGSPSTSGRILRSVLFKGPRRGSIGLLRDLQDLTLLVHGVHGNWTIVGQVAAALRDRELRAACECAIPQTLRQIEWLDTRIKELAPQALATSR